MTWFAPAWSLKGARPGFETISTCQFAKTMSDLFEGPERGDQSPVIRVQSHMKRTPLLVPSIVNGWSEMFEEPCHYKIIGARSRAGALDSENIFSVFAPLIMTVSKCTRNLRVLSCLLHMINVDFAESEAPKR